MSNTGRSAAWFEDSLVVDRHLKPSPPRIHLFSLVGTGAFLTGEGYLGRRMFHVKHPAY